MKWSNGKSALVSLTILGFTSVLHAENQIANSTSALDWQIQRLTTPTPQQRAAEYEGRVFIYDSLDINDVESAMDNYFDRIENMMFIRIHHPPEGESELANVEDDGC